jgi:hypothetical protein
VVCGRDHDHHHFTSRDDRLADGDVFSGEAFVEVSTGPS